MSTKITNIHGIPIALIPWLLADNYDYQAEKNHVSVTTLLKPLRQMVLSARTMMGHEVIPDLSDYIARAMGNSLHDSIEKSWHHSRQSLTMVGIPQNAIDKILINPSDEELSAVKDAIPIYLEQRSKKQIGNWVVSGKFDMVAEGIVHDNKSTSTFTWTSGSNDENYCLQGSLYRYLNPEKITGDFIRINFLFTDWQKYRARQNPDYPQAKVQQKEIPLLSIAETEAWILNKLAMIERYMDAPDHEIPLCTDDELWKAPTEYKYYAKPEQTRATKNFETDYAAAKQYMMVEKKGLGLIKTIEGEAKRCDYCDAVGHCSQAKKLGKHD